MRRILFALIAVAALVGLASPAFAAAGTTDHPRPIHLACDATTLNGKPALHCSWDAYTGATSYRVVVAAHRRHHRGAWRRTVTETEFTRNVAPGRYNVLVRAMDGSRHPLARSNRVRVVVPRPGS